jgi:hypothetical protein
MKADSVHHTFTAALDALIDHVKEDRSILAAVLCGSLSHDTVWAIEGSVNNSFFHAFLAKGRLLYTHDRTIEEMCARLHEIGERDTKLQLLQAATFALPLIDKARKWFVTRGDLNYSALWILAAATSLAGSKSSAAG